MGLDRQAFAMLVKEHGRWCLSYRQATSPRKNRLWAEWVRMCLQLASDSPAVVLHRLKPSCIDRGSLSVLHRFRRSLCCRPR